MTEDVDEVRRRVEQLRTERLLDQAEGAQAALERDRGDHVARGSLGEAVAALLDRDGSVAPLAPEVRDRLVSARDRLLAPTPPPRPIRTERLVLREPRMEDVDALHAYYRREDVALHLLTTAPSREEMLVDVQRRTGGGPAGLSADVLPLVIELDGQCVGDLVLMLKGPSYSVAEVGWTVNPEHGGRGVVTEGARALVDVAFEHYRVHRVYAELDARNERSAALCERLGMRQESHARQDYWSKGEWTDSQRYAVLREEWAERRSDGR